MADLNGWVERNRGHVLVTLINLAALGVAVFWLRQPGPATMEIVTSGVEGSAAHADADSRSPLRVYVSGAVFHPDVYTVATGSLVKDALDAAGGAAERADLDHVNLAKELFDQEQVYVPFTGEFEGPPTRIDAAIRVGDHVSQLQGSAVNINTATAADLQELPGIGPSLAQRIVDYRSAHGPFTTVEDVMDVPGIGEVTYQRIRDRLVLR